MVLLFQVIYQRDPSVIMYSYLVSKDEYSGIKQQPRNEGQNLYFPKREENIQPTDPTQNDRQSSQSTGVEGESISFTAGQLQPSFPRTGAQGRVPYPNTGGQGGEGESISFLHGKKQTPYPNTGGQGFSYPQRQGYGGEQSKNGKQVNTCFF